jgi:hypothetical protein
LTRRNVFRACGLCPDAPRQENLGRRISSEIVSSEPNIIESGRAIEGYKSRARCAKVGTCRSRRASYQDQRCQVSCIRTFVRFTRPVMSGILL